MERIANIIKELGSQKRYVRIDDLAELFKVTPRTIRNDLEEIELLLEKENIRIEKDRKQGVRLTKNNLSQKEINELIYRINNNKDYYSSEERERIIIEKLLFLDSPITLKELEDLTLTSRSSLQKNILECEKRLCSWGINLRKTQHVGLSIESDEYNWRVAVTNHITLMNKDVDFQQLYTALVNGRADWIATISNKNIKNIFDNVNTQFIVNFIRRYETINRIRFTDNAFVRIFIFLCVTISENNKGKVLDRGYYSISNFYDEKTLNTIIKQSIEYINNGSQTKLNHNELETILVYMLSQKRVNDDNHYDETFLLNDKGFLHKSYEIVKCFIERIDEYLNTDLSGDRKLFENLLLHIRPTIYRLLFGIALDNPLLNNIKESFPEVFAACKYASKVITDETNNVINESEISYLTLHVQASIEKKSETNFNGLYKTLIVCPEGVGTSTILYYRLLNSIPNIIIDKICSITEFNNTDSDKIDLIISTVPINHNKKSNIVVVNPLLYDEDISKIRQAMRKISIFRNISSVDMMVDDIVAIISKYAIINDYKQLENEIGSYFDNIYTDRKDKKPSLDRFISRDFIQLNQCAQDWEDAFRKAGQILLDQKFITANYIDHCIRAVKTYGPYMFIGEKVALMHANSADDVKKTGIGVLTLKGPVVLDFEGKEYDISMIVILSVREGMDHLQALGELIEITGDKNKVQNMLEIEDKDEFVEFIRNNIGDIDMSKYED